MYDELLSSLPLNLSQSGAALLARVRELLLGHRAEGVYGKLCSHSPDLVSNVEVFFAYYSRTYLCM